MTGKTWPLQGFNRVIDSGLDFAALAKENDSLLIMTDLTCAPP